MTKSEVIKYSASGFRDFTRLAASDPTMWRDVCLHNKDAILEMLARFSEDLSSLQRAIRWGDGDKLFDLFTRTRAVRRSIIEAGQEIDVPDFGRQAIEHPKTLEIPKDHSGGISPSGMKPSIALPLLIFSGNGSLPSQPRPRSPCWISSGACAGIALASCSRQRLAGCARRPSSRHRASRPSPTENGPVTDTPVAGAGRQRQLADRAGLAAQAAVARTRPGDAVA